MEEKKSGRLFVLKTLSAHYGENALSSLRREFLALKYLSHPCLCAVHEFEAAPGEPARLLRDFVPGRPLLPGPPPEGKDPATFLRPVLDVLAALAFLHYNGFRHLDIHAGNVIERPEGRGVLIDIGLFPPSESGGGNRKAKTDLHSGARTKTASSAGPDVEPRADLSDLYGAGRLLLYRLTGRYEKSAPFTHLTHWEDRTALHLEHVVERTLSTDPEIAFPSAEAFLSSLCSVLGVNAEEVLVPGESHLFVGRRTVLEKVDRLFRKLEAGEGSCLWIYGPPGSGKTRCLAEVKSQAEISGVPVRSFRFFSNCPFSSSSFSDLFPGTDRSDFTHRAEAADSELLAHRVFRKTIRTLLESEQNLLLVLDDFQLADPVARSLILSLLRKTGEVRGSRLGIVLASAEKPREKSTPAVSLSPLSSREASQLFNQLIFPLRLHSEDRRRIISLTKGNPALLRRAARALKQEENRRVSSERARHRKVETGFSDEKAPLFKRFDARALFRREILSQDPQSKRILRFLALFARPVTAAELSRATGIAVRVLKKKLEETAGLVGFDSCGPRGKPAYYLASDSLREEILKGVTEREKRAMHRACASAVKPRKTEALLLADLVRHYVLGGEPETAYEYLLPAVEALRRDGNAAAACRLVFLLFEKKKDRRYELAFLLSDLARRSGRNELAYKALLRILPGARGRRKLEILRRLGTHAFRLGREKKACDFLARVLKEAHPKRDRDAIIEADAELADILISRGDFSRAERACGEGLSLLEQQSSDRKPAARESEVTLRAIAGRLSLRRLDFDRAIRELRHALRLARTLPDERPQALILNNLGVAYNQSNDFKRARSTYRAAERLSRRLGHEEALVHITCNLALIAAKTGEAAEAERRLSHARALVEEIPGERLRFMAAQAETVVFLLLGQSEKAEASAACAIQLGKRTGELAHVHFLELYRAEALLETAQYAGAEKILRRLVRTAKDHPLLRRMAQVRLAFLLSVTGSSKPAERIISHFAAEPPTSVVYLEAWNDFFIGQAQESLEGDGRRSLDRAYRTFHELGIPFGATRCAVALLRAAVRHKDESGMRPLLTRLESFGESGQARLDSEVPLACAEACLFLGETERARQYLSTANGAIVGKAFPEIDLLLETMWAKLSALTGDIARARRHLHRAHSLRSHLSERVSEKKRRLFLRQPRWRDLVELEESLFTRKAAVRRTQVEDSFGIVARSHAMQEVVRQIRRIGPRDLSVLIRGPTGSGKDLVAQALHRASARSEAPFVTVHVPSLKEELFESELFGYEKGAFTGAEKDRTGLLAGAGGGTVCFDEIAALPLPSQAKLLRVLDRREVRPLGATESRPLDIRFLFTTDKDLRLLAARGSFREDLYWRVAQSEIVVPGLSHRKEDMEELVSVLLRKHARLGRPVPDLAPGVLPFLCAAKWPGNVRQLETVLVRALLASEGEEPLTVELLEAVMSSPHQASWIPEELLENDDLEAVRREVEIAWLKKRFIRAGGSMSTLARKLRMSRSSLYAWFKRMGVDPDLWRREIPGKGGR